MGGIGEKRKEGEKREKEERMELSLCTFGGFSDSTRGIKSGLPSFGD